VPKGYTGRCHLTTKKVTPAKLMIWKNRESNFSSLWGRCGGLLPQRGKRRSCRLRSVGETSPKNERQSLFISNYELFTIDIYIKKYIVKNSMDEELEEIEKAISRYVENSITPIIADYEDKKTGERKVGIHGTGTLFKFLDKYFLITAAHVLTATEGYEECVGIPVGKNRTKAIKFKECTSTP